MRSRSYKDILVVLAPWIRNKELKKIIKSFLTKDTLENQMKINRVMSIVIVRGATSSVETAISCEHLNHACRKAYTLLQQALMDSL
jgi:hypothetical protein